MAKIRWTKLAKADLQSIYEYISQDSIVYADKQIDNIIEKVEMLTSFVSAGRVVPEFNDANIREVIEGNYRIVYKVVSIKSITVLRIHHSARLLKP